jgi:hypothetical protein
MDIYGDQDGKPLKYTEKEMPFVELVAPKRWVRQKS